MRFTSEKQIYLGHYSSLGRWVEERYWLRYDRPDWYGKWQLF
tara:strand:+ start:5625 stop:5750 length:126 start_codon:yes stop_codon:yes gene_type:complete